MPRSEVPHGKQDGEDLAKTVAAGLARSLRQGHVADAAGSLAAVRVRVPREQSNAEGVARAIHASISKEIALARKER
jgi:hypothetical protein